MAATSLRSATLQKHLSQETPDPQPVVEPHERLYSNDTPGFWKSGSREVGMTAVIFDLDGTLVESDGAIRDVANGLFTELGLEPLSLDEVRSFVGAGSPIFLERAFGARDFGCDGAAFSGHYDRLMTLYAESPGAANVPMPGADVVLRDLASAGHPIGLCTNKSAIPTQNVLEAHSWTPLFKTVIAGDTLPERKPDPTPLLEAARRLEGSSTVYVGDSDVDAATAAAAGIPFILYTEGYRKAAVEALPHAAAFSDYARLPELIEAVAGQSG